MEDNPFQLLAAKHQADFSDPIMELEQPLVMVMIMMGSEPQIQTKLIPIGLREFDGSVSFNVFN